MFVDTLWPWARYATASFSRLLDTHSSGRFGQPKVMGAKRASRSRSSVASLSVKRLRPPPARRNAVSGAGVPAAISFRPRPMVLRAIPVARLAHPAGPLAEVECGDQGVPRARFPPTPSVPRNILTIAGR